MKRTFKRPDGTEETLEGTADELAEYERKLNESERKAPKPGVLKGRELEDLLRRVRDETPERPPRPWIRRYPDPIWIVSCSVCGRINCKGCHGFPISPWGGFTITMANLRSDTQSSLCHGSVSS